jgi:hypothetical protein
MDVLRDNETITRIDLDDKGITTEFKEEFKKRMERKVDIKKN